MKITRQECAIYSRVVGWLTPIHKWNPGKRAEFDQRKVFIINNKEIYANINRTTN